MGRDNRRVVVFKNMVSPYTNRLFNGLVEAGVNVQVASCVEQEPNRSWATTMEKLYESHVLSGVTVKVGTGRYAHASFGIYRYLNRVQPEAVMINGFYPSMLIAASWAIVHRKPLGLTIDGWRNTMPQTLYHRIVRPPILARCQVIVPCGTKGAQYFLAEGVPERNIVTVPLVPAWDGPSTVTPFSARRFDVIWAAHINDEAKNASFFADVVVRLKVLKPDVTVRLVGTGPAQQKILSRLTDAGVAWTHGGVVDWREMGEVFSSGRVLLLPSLWEPWGLVCNEAMQCGAPCVVSPLVGAADDLVVSGVNGEVCELDADLWAQRTLSIVTDPARWGQLSTEARAAAAARSLEKSLVQFQSALALLV
jgi:glycosyltransferase involved in cell wall biosynthesis